MVIDSVSGKGVSGERFVPSANAGGNEMIVNLERYLYALHHVEGKTVLDAGCGSGLGSYLYGLIAKKVIALDYSDEAFEYLARFPVPPGKVETLKADVEKEGSAGLPKVDVCVAIEFLEHIADPHAFLRDLKADTLVFSVPLHSLAVSKFHKFAIGGDIYEVKKLIDPYYQVGEYHLQYNRWVYGAGKRR